MVALLATVVPLIALLAWVWPVLAARWKASGSAARVALAGLWLLGSGFLLAFPHEDRFTGLDNMTYPQLAQAFLDGRGFHDADTVLAEVPKPLRENFLLHRGPKGRPTRDRAFQLAGWGLVRTQPFFMPVLPLAAAALDPVPAPERLVPLAGSLWLALVLAAGFCAGGGWGLVAVTALVTGTAWPAWFLRGFYAEGVGALLVAGVVAAVSIRPLRGGMTVCAGFALGLAATYHPTLLVLGVPVALGLMLESGHARDFWRVTVGMLAGIIPLWALTRWVCQPYGDWTRWGSLREMIWSVPEHRFFAVALAGLALVSLVAVWAGFRPDIRAGWRRMDTRAVPWVWAAVCGLPLVLMAVLPPIAGNALRLGAVSVWSGIRWPCALWMLVGVACIFNQRRPARERFWLAAMAWGALLFLFVQGVETPVGLWSQRRFLPVILTGIPLLAAPLAAGWSGLPRRSWRWLVFVLALVAGTANLVRWPAAFVSVNEQGATQWTQPLAERIGTRRRVVFDYYPHSVPYAAGLKHRTLGLGETSRNHWPEVARWLMPLAAQEEVWLVSSWSPTALEEGVRLEPVFSVTGAFPVVRTKAFFPAVPGWHTVQNHFMRAVPLAAGESAFQDKRLDGSPIGLRGPWGAIRSGAAWTREGSGIIGPVPGPGESVVFEAEGIWVPPAEDWPRQTLRVTPPWGGVPLELEVASGEHRIHGILTRPAADGMRPPTGIFELHAERPYDPAAFGLRGYADDLGVQLRRIIIRIESGGPSVPN